MLPQAVRTTVLARCDIGVEFFVRRIQDETSGRLSYHRTPEKRPNQSFGLATFWGFVLNSASSVTSRPDMCTHLLCIFSSRIALL